MLHDNNLTEMSLRHNRSEPLFRTIRELPGFGRKKTWDKRRSTTTKKLTIKFHGRTAKANTNFYISYFTSNEFRFSFSNKKSGRKIFNDYFRR